MTVKYSNLKIPLMIEVKIIGYSPFRTMLSALTTDMNMLYKDSMCT